VNEALRARLEGYLKESAKSQAVVAKEIGISGAALSQYLSGKYPTPGSIEPKIEEFFSLKEAAATITKAPDYVDTSISTETYNIIAYCHASRCIGAIIGDAGIGKTKGAQKYVNDYSQAVFITANRVCKNPRDIYRMIAKKLKLDHNRRLSDLHYDIRSELDGSNKLIIIDEAQHLSLPALDGIRNFNDENFESGLPPVGIVLIGNHELLTKMMGRYDQPLAQLFSRVQIRRQMYANQLLKEDIEKLFPVLVERKAVKEIEYLYNIARTSRCGIRGAVKVFLNSSNNEDISYNGLVAAAKYMGIGLSA